MRIRHWMLLAIAAIYAALYFGLDAAFERAAEEMASGPSVAPLFADPLAGRGQALLLVFGFLLSVPLVVVGVACLGMGAWTLFKAAGDALRMPPWVPGGALVVATTWILYAGAGWWWPRLLLAVGVLARAWIVLTL